MKRILLVKFLLFISLAFAFSKGYNGGYGNLSDSSDDTKQKTIIIDLGHIPTDAEKKALEKKGIFLKGFYSGTAYFAVQKAGLRMASYSNVEGKVEDINLSVKLGPYLLNKEIPDHAWVDGKKEAVRVTVVYFPDFDKSLIGGYIQRHKLKNVYPMDIFHMFNVDLPLDLVEDLAKQDWVRRIECMPPPDELFNRQGRTMSRASVLAYNGIGGRNLTGKGVRVGIWDGNIESHPDLGNRATTRQFLYPSAHGQHVSGTMIGSGLLDPRARGMAPEATAYTWNFNQPRGSSVPLEMAKCINNDKIVVTQNSYGLPNKNFCDRPRQYDVQEQQMDLLANMFPSVLHVFAAGNDQMACGGVSRYLTSSKRAKNIIMVGAIDETTKMSNFSSWGPTDDGRILPHISAFGVGVYSTVYNNKYEGAEKYWDGTSMACPVVSGISTLLYERYRQLNNGENPEAILIKGALLNTAEDKGNIGPDYQFGYGRADGEEAVKVLENQQYILGEIRNGEIKEHTISIPNGAKELNVMVVWSDKEGKTETKALINDIDIVAEANGTVYQPWVLNPSKPALPATKGIDHLNNQEQITIKDPATTYKVQVKGFKIPEGPQRYALVYSYKMQELRVIYPNGGEKFEPKEFLVARWNAVGYTGKVNVQLSLDGGKTFQTLKENIDVNTKDLKIQIPENAQTDKAVLRVIQNGTMDISDTPFVIMGRPHNLRYQTSPCSDSNWKLLWDAVQGAVKYEVLYADVANGTFSKVGEATTPSFDLPQLDNSKRNIYTVVAVTQDGYKSERAKAVIADVAGTVPVTANTLPFKEEFAMIPSRFLNITKGENVTVDYKQLEATVDKPSKKGHLLFMKGNDKTANWDETDVWANNPKNLSQIKFCNIDATQVTGKLWLRLGVLMPMDKEAKDQNYYRHLRVLADGKVLTNTYGEADMTKQEKGKIIKYYDLSESAGKNFAIEFQSVTRNAKDVVYIGLIEIFEAKNDVAFGGMTVPAPKEQLSATEDIKVRIRNNDGKEVSNVPVRYYINNQLIASEVVNQTIKPFGFVDYTFATKADLSEKDKKYDIKVELAMPTDINPENNTGHKITASLGDYYRIPQATGYSTPEKKVTTKILKFTDDGAKVFDYANRYKGAVIFKPTTVGAKVKLKFTEFDTEAYDKVIIHDGPYPSSKVLAVLSGKVEMPKVFTSTSSYGEIFVEFQSNSSVTKAGWLAEVTETTDPADNFTNNIFTLTRINTESGYYDAPTPIKVDIQNNLKEEQKNVKVAYNIDGGNWVEEVIPSIPATNTLEYTFNKKAEIQAYPKQYTINIKVFLEKDVYLEDNEISKNIVNDKYCVSTSGNSNYTGLCLITKVEKGDVVNETPSTKQGARTPQYFRDKKFVVYKDMAVNNLEVSVVNHSTSTGYLGLWVDWNNDGKFDEKTEKVALSGDVATGELELKKLNIIVPATVQAGDYNARLRVGTGAFKGLCAVDGYGTNGEVEDYTITVKEQYPYQKDIAVLGTEMQSGKGLTTAETVSVLLENKGAEAITTFTVSYKIDDKPVVEEVVNQNIPAGETYTYTFTQKADFSVSGLHKLVLTAKLEGDAREENNTFTAKIINEKSAENGFYALDFDGKDDFVNLGTLGDTNLQQFTFETWIKPDSYGGYGSVGFGRLFEGKGATIFLCNEHSFYPKQSIIVAGIGGTTFQSPASTIALDKWQHIAVTYDFDMTVKLYVNGQEVALQKSEKSTDIDKTKIQDNSQKELFVGNRPKLDRAFDGMMDEVRIWNKVRTTTEILGGMYVHQKGQAGLVGEFSFDEGFYNTSVTSNTNYVGKILNAKVEEGDGSIWVVPNKLLASIAYPKQVTDWKKDGVKEIAEVEKDADLSQMIGKFVTTWPNTLVKVSGAEQQSEVTANDFTNSEASPVVYTLSATVFGKELTEEHQLVLKKEASTACELKGLQIPAVSVDKSPVEELNTFEVSVSDVTALVTNFQLSKGAKAFVNGVEITSGMPLDYTKPIVIKVVAENGRAYKEYSITLKKKQTITWDVQDDERVKVYGDTDFTLTATASSNNEVYYTSSNTDVISIVKNKAVIKGVGVVTITANVPADNTNLEATPVSYTYTVNKKPLTITAENKEVDYLEPIPALTMSYDGFVKGEDESVLDEKPQIATTATQGTVAGTYDITLSGGTDKHYEYVLQNGTLTIRDTSPQNVIFEVTFEGNPDADVTISVHGQEVKTDTNGRATVKLNPGTYKYTLTKDGQETKEGEITVADAEQTIAIVMTKPLPIYTVKYVTDGNGALDGVVEQKIKQGQNGMPVKALPNLGYDFEKWSDNSTNATHTAQNVQADVTYTATFKIKKLTLKYTSSANGKLEGEVSQTVDFGSDGTEVKAVANEGYTFSKWSDGVTQNPRKDVKVAKDINVEAQYVKAFILPYTQDFAGGSLPTAWNAVDNAGDGIVWEFKKSAGYGTVLKDSSPNTAIIESKSKTTADADLISPVFDMSKESSVTLKFRHFFKKSYDSYGAVYYSINNGDWVEIQKWDKTTLNSELFEKKIPEVAGQSNVRFKWKYFASGWEWYWLVDDVEITGEQVASEYPVIYRAGQNGTLENANADGTITATVKHGEKSPSVKAVPNAGFVFDKWSDGVTLNPRQDNVTSKIDVTAEFRKDCSVVIDQVPYIEDFEAKKDEVPDCWENPVGTNDLKWKVGFGTTIAKNGQTASVGGYDTPYGKKSSAELITSQFDLSKYSAIYVSFKHSIIAFSGTAKATFFYTIDGGVNWVKVQDWAKKVDDLYFVKQIPEIAGQANVKFKWNFEGDWGTKYIIDDFELRTKQTYMLSYEADYKYEGGKLTTYGTIEGETIQVVEEGQSGTSVKAIAEKGYKFVKWSDEKTDNPRTDVNVVANAYFVAKFVETSEVFYTVTYTAGTGGSISGEANQQVKEGEDATEVEAVADTGYKFVKWSDDKTDNPRTDMNVTADIAVTAEFAKIEVEKFTLTYTAGAGGTIEGTTPQTVEKGASGTAVTAKANAGYKFVKWSDDKTNNPRTDANVTANITVTAEFKKVDTNTSGVKTIPYKQPFAEAEMPKDWTVKDNAGSNCIWEFKAKTDGYFGVSMKDIAPNHAIMDAGKCGYSTQKNADLISPVFDFSANATVELKFVHFYKASYGSKATLYYTKDEGATWVLLKEFEGMQDADAYDKVVTPEKFKVNLNDLAGESKVQFKWSFENGNYYWLVDDIELSEATISNYKVVYTASTGGRIDGKAEQDVKEHTDTEEVTAVAEAGYHFVKWSDGKTDKTRKETDVTKDMELLAKFVEDLPQGNVYTLPYKQDFKGDTAPTDWVTVDNELEGCNWEFKAEGGGTGSTYSPKVSLKGSEPNSAFMDAYMCGRNTKKEADLVSPIFDFSQNSTVKMKFKHHYKKGFNNDEKASLSYTEDGGKTWIELKNFTEELKQYPYTNENPTAFEQDLNELAGKSNIRFKWTLKSGSYYWIVDDLELTGEKKTTPKHTITYVAGANGSITGTMVQTLDKGTTTTEVTAVPATGYRFKQWSDGKTEANRTDVVGDTDVTFTAEFVKKTYKVLYNSDVNGSIQGDKEQTVEHGSSASSVTATANVGYKFVKWSDGKTDNPRTDVNVTADITVTAEFAKVTYKVIYNSDANGTIEGEKEQTIEHGSSASSVTATANAGYKFVKWSDGNTDNPRTDANVTADITVTAEFEKITYKVIYNSDANGSIEGDKEQTIEHGSSTSSVTAKAKEGYKFVKWSDDNTDNPRTDTNVTANITVTAEFAKVEVEKFTLTYVAGAGGMIEGTAIQTVEKGANGTAVTATANAGYKFVKWSDGNTDNPRTDTNVTANISVTAEFAKITYKVIYNSDANGSIEGDNEQTVEHGSSTSSVTATANAGYKFVKWSDDKPDNPRTDVNVTANITVTAEFAKVEVEKFTLTYVAGAGGMIEGTAIQTVEKGANGTAVTATANAGYKFVKWSDGKTDNPRTDVNVTADITVTAEFAKITYKVIYNSDANGTIEGEKEQTIEHGSSTSSVTATANTGYKFVKWSDDRTDNPRTDTNVTANITVTAEFAKVEVEKFTLTYVAGAGGMIEGTAIQTVEKGANGTAVTATANAGYKFVKWSDGNTDNPRTDVNVTADITVTAEFTKVEVEKFTLTYIAGDGGTIEGTATQTVEKGANGTTVTAKAKEGYKFVKWSDGNTDNPRTDVNVTADITVTAEFAKITYKVIYNSDANGTIEGEKEQTIEHGSSTSSVTATANAGYKFVKWSDGKTDNPRTDTNVTADLTVSAEFAKITYKVVYNSDDNGTIEGDKEQTIEHGSSTSTVTAKAKEGYKFVKWSDGKTDNPRTDANVIADISVTAEFAKITYKVIYNSDANGTIEGDKEQIIEYGSSTSSVTVKAKDGYKFVKWSDGNVDNPRTDVNVMADITVTAEFAKEEEKKDEEFFLDLRPSELLTPNGDRLNDEWSIDKLVGKPNMVRIFDKTGVLVYQKKDYMLDEERFEGFAKDSKEFGDGEELPVGIYFYFIDLETGYKKKGFLYIIK